MRNLPTNSCPSLFSPSFASVDREIRENTHCSSPRRAERQLPSRITIKRPSQNGDWAPDRSSYSREMKLPSDGRSERHCPSGLQLEPRICPFIRMLMSIFEMCNYYPLNKIHKKWKNITWVHGIAKKCSGSHNFYVKLQISQKKTRWKHGLYHSLLQTLKKVDGCIDWGKKVI